MTALSLLRTPVTIWLRCTLALPLHCTPTPCIGQQKSRRPAGPCVPVCGRGHREDSCNYKRLTSYHKHRCRNFEKHVGHGIDFHSGRLNYSSMKGRCVPFTAYRSDARHMARNKTQRNTSLAFGTPRGVWQRSILAWHMRVVALYAPIPSLLAPATDLNSVPRWINQLVSFVVMAEARRFGPTVCFTDTFACQMSEWSAEGGDEGRASRRNLGGLKDS